MSSSQHHRSPASAPFVGRILLDIPAQRPTLNFGQIARALAAVIGTSEPRFAVGVFGGWGSGKSTLMDEIERLVEGQEGAITVRFNAWRFERESHLIIPLLDTIRFHLSEWASNSAEDPEQKEKVRSIARRIGRVVKALVRSTSLEFGLPGMSLSVEPTRAIEELTSTSADAAEAAQSLYFAAFQELSAAFAEVRNANLLRIVVFVDDLDRCLPQQALAMLESMKLFFDMPGFVFVVGVDERVIESAVRTKFANTPEAGHEVDKQIERDYLKKMFQVPYTLPPMAAGQLGQLLAWLGENGHLGPEQRADLDLRVRNYLEFVAVDGEINPREIKRFINAYTLSRMIRPDLEPDIMLALQTIDFRGDWEEFYEGVILAEPETFGRVLEDYRQGDDAAFEDLWPEIGVIPRELSEYLRSRPAAALAAPFELPRYVSFLETTRSTDPSIVEAMRNLGRLRRQLRTAGGDDIRPGSPAARLLATQIKDAIGRLRYYSESKSRQLQQPLHQLNDLAELLSGSSSEGSPGEDDRARSRIESAMLQAPDAMDEIQLELRHLRRSSAFGGK